MLDNGLNVSVYVEFNLIHRNPTQIRDHPAKLACRAGLDYLLLFLELIKKGVGNRQGLFRCEEKERLSVCVGRGGVWMGLDL